MRALKLLLNAIAIFMSLVVVLYLVAVAINWRDVAPSDEFVRLKRVIADRPAVDDADNGFIYLLGIAAAKDELPGGVGAQRGAWLEAVNLDIRQSGADPARAQIDFVAGRHADLQEMFESCSDLLGRACRAAFEAAPPVASWSETDHLLLERYREFVQRPAWREIVPTDVRAPLASYQHAIGGLRLQMLALRGADATELREVLARDARFWRGMNASADVLIGKMIAVAGLRQHFWFGNLLLRDRPAADAARAIPDEWRRELTPAELALERALAAELTTFEGTLRNPGEVDVLEEDWWGDPRRSNRLDRRLRRAAMRPFYQPQDVLNHVAADYVAVAKAFDVPLAGMTSAAEAWHRRPATDPFPSRIYDATGDYVREMFIADYSEYALRIATIEGMRRAVLVTTELRARGVPATDVAAGLATSSLRDPFDGAAFAWNTKEQAVEYVGPDAHKWRRGLFYY